MRILCLIIHLYFTKLPNNNFFLLHLLQKSNVFCQECMYKLSIILLRNYRNKRNRPELNFKIKIAVNLDVASGVYEYA